MGKNLLIGGLAAVSLALGIYVFKGPRQEIPAPPPGEDRVAALQAEIDQLKEQLTARDRDIIALRNALASLRAQQVADLTHQANPAATPPAGIPLSSSPEGSPDQAGKRLAESLAGMIGPALEQALGKAMSGASRRPSRERYAALARQLHLSPEQAEALYAELDRAPAGLAFTMTPDGQLKQGNPDREPALRELLGESGYAALEAYEETLPARDTVHDFERQLTENGRALSDPQRQRLIDLFAANAANLSPDQSSFSVDLAPGQSVDEQVDAQMEQELAGWDRVMEGARQTLDAEQITALDHYMGEQLARREATARTTAEAAQRVSALAPGATNLTGGTQSVRVISIDAGELIMDADGPNP